MNVLYDTGWAAPPSTVEPRLIGDTRCDAVVRTILTEAQEIISDRLPGLLAAQPVG